MPFDLRLPIGILFTLFGLILCSYGVFSPPAIYAKSLGLNVNLWWGFVLLAFGATMWAFALRARGKH